MSAISAAGTRSIGAQRRSDASGRLPQAAERTVAAIALACREDLEYGAHRQQALIRLLGERAVLLRGLLRLVKRNCIKLA